MHVLLMYSFRCMGSVSCLFMLTQKSSYKTTPAPFDKVVWWVSMTSFCLVFVFLYLNIKQIHWWYDDRRNDVLLSLSILSASSCHRSGECVSRLSHSWRHQRASGQGHSSTFPEEVQQRKSPQQLLHSGEHHQGQFTGNDVSIDRTMSTHCQCCPGKMTLG